MTLDERGGYEICPVCFWEDDGQDDQDASRVRGGPNGSLSLEQARRNFASFNACDEKSRQHVRPPNPDEAQVGARRLLPPNWSELTSVEAEPLESELRRELPRTHLLFGRELRALARRDGYDDVLFAPTAARTPVYWVHLTWSVETDAAWPWTEKYGDLAEFTDRWIRENPGDDTEDAG